MIVFIVKICRNPVNQMAARDSMKNGKEFHWSYKETFHLLTLGACFNDIWGKDNIPFGGQHRLLYSLFHTFIMTHFHVIHLVDSTRNSSQFAPLTLFFYWIWVFLETAAELGVVLARDAELSVSRRLACVSDFIVRSLERYGVLSGFCFLISKTLYPHIPQTQKQLPLLIIQLV